MQSIVKYVLYIMHPLVILISVQKDTSVGSSEKRGGHVKYNKDKNSDFSNVKGH